MTTIWRLLWALPLVLAFGVAVMLVLRRFVLPSRRTQTEARMSMRGSLPLSDKTCVHLIEVEGNSYLVVESTQQAALQPVLSSTSEVPRSPARFGPPWVRRLYRAESR